MYQMHEQLISFPINYYLIGIACITLTYRAIVKLANLFAAYYISPILSNLLHFIPEHPNPFA